MKKGKILKDKTIQVPVTKETLSAIEEMMEKDGYTEYAPWFRRIVFKEYERQHIQPQLLPTVGEATSGPMNTEEK